MIWNTAHNEFGSYSGGQQGDQDGTESCIRTWFSSPWDCVLRWPDQALAAEAAELGRQAAENDCVGYCQSHRNSFYDQLAATGTWEPKDISTPCETDCCRSCTTIWQAVGERHGIDALKLLDPDPYGDTTYTANARERYADAGFQVLTGSFFVDSDAHLLPGDCLLNEGTHMAMQLDVGWDVDDGVWTPGDSSDSTEGATLGTAFIEAGATYKVVDGPLNVRDAPGTSGAIVASYPVGETVVLDGWSCLVDGVVWGRYTGSASGKLRYIAVCKVDVTQEFLAVA